MNFVDYIHAYERQDAELQKDLRPLRINLITNFTDAVLEKVLGGMCLTEGIRPSITRAPYKQYPMVLKNNSDALVLTQPEISFVFFDINTYRHAEFAASPDHDGEVLDGLRTYCDAVGTTVVASLCVLPYHGPYGVSFNEDPLFSKVKAFNKALMTLAKEVPNLIIFDTNKIVHRLGESHARDMRGTMAFDMPFTNDFLVALCHEWFSYINATTGRSRKCIVVDLDNTLWGGVVGEAGPLGIEVGPEYPGLAYQNFQRALKKLLERGVLLAVNSKNNAADVDEVFEKNHSMILKKDDFAAICTNWQEKSENIKSIAQELNIGTDSLVFLDDSAVERDLVRLALPEVFTPDMPKAPEEYAKALFSLNVFHQMSLTDEDKNKAIMYNEERARKRVLESASNKEDYIAKLGIVVTVAEGEDGGVPRIAQLTQKTNQFNLTTKRYSEGDIVNIIKNGATVFSGHVKDKYGDYGTVVLAICMVEGTHACLDTFLMSCRVMGRGVEHAFLTFCIKELKNRGVHKLHASFETTAKNAPAAGFLPEIGFVEAAGAEAENGTYYLDIGNFLQTLTKDKVEPIITVRHLGGVAS